MVTLSLTRFKSLEFLLAATTAIAAWLAQAAGVGNMTPHDAALFTAGSAIFYAISRGLAKQNADHKPFYMTSEFYGSVIAAAATLATAYQGDLSPTTWQLMLGLIGAAAAVSNGHRTPPEVATSQDPGKVQ